MRGGEVVTSARAIDEETIHKLYDFNMSFHDSSSSRKADMDEIEQWGGREVRLQLQTLYLLSFLCLLRFDEALRIEWSWIRMTKIQNPSGKWIHQIEIQLPFRKTNQTGGVST